MKRFRFSAVLLAVCLSSGGAVLAADGDPLFVNLTSDDAYRSDLAISVSKHMMDRGHPLTIFFNDRGIFVVSRSNAEQFKTQQAVLAELFKAGATLIACPKCMKHYDVQEGDLLEGVKVGNAQVTGDALFRENTRTLSW